MDTRIGKDTNKILNAKTAYLDSMRMSRQDFECQNNILRLCANVKLLIGFRMSKTIFSHSANLKLGFRMSKKYVSTQCECQNKILYVKFTYFDSERMSK